LSFKSLNSSKVQVGCCISNLTLIYPLELDWVISNLMPYPRDNYSMLQIPNLGVVQIKTGLHRLCLLKRSKKCVFCGAEAKHCFLCVDEADYLSVQFFSAKGIIFDVDHIIPKSKGGLNDMLNLQLSCKKCNSKKSNKVSLIAQREQFVLAKQRELKFKYDNLAKGKV